MDNIDYSDYSRYAVGSVVQITYSIDDFAMDLVEIEGTVIRNDPGGPLVLMRDGKNVEITYEHILDSYVVKQPPKDPSVIPCGALVCFTKRGAGGASSDIRGKVSANDISSRRIRFTMEDGKERILAYALIESYELLSNADGAAEADAGSGSAPEPEAVPIIRSGPFRWEKEMGNKLIISDQAMKELLDSLPATEKTELNASFKNVLSALHNDNEKQQKQYSSAAESVFRNGRARGKEYSNDALLLCAHMLSRAKNLDHAFLAEFGCYHEAALLAKQTGNANTEMAAYAVMDIRESNSKDRELSLDLLARGSFIEKDVSGISLLASCDNAEIAAAARELAIDIAAFEGITVYESESTDEILDKLSEKYNNTGISLSVLAMTGPRTTVTEIEPIIKNLTGSVTFIDSHSEKGRIIDYDGKEYGFDFSDVIKGSDLHKVIGEKLMIGKPEKMLPVLFNAQGNKALKVKNDSNPSFRARAICDAPGVSIEKLRMAFEICQYGLSSNDSIECGRELLKSAVKIYESSADESCLETAINAYNDSISKRDQIEVPPLALAQCYGYLKDYESMCSHAMETFGAENLAPADMMKIIGYAAKMFYGYYADTQNKDACVKLLDLIELVKERFGDYMESNLLNKEVYGKHVCPYIVMADCVLEKHEEAEAEYQKLVPGFESQPEVEKSMFMLRTSASEQPVPESDLLTEEESFAEGEETEPNDDENDGERFKIFDIPEEDEEDEEEEQEEEGEEEEEEVYPEYKDIEGWPDLELTEDAFIERIFSAAGRKPDKQNDLPAVLTYLKAGAKVQSDIQRYYKIAALALNDPFDAHEYTLDYLYNTRYDSNLPFMKYCLAASLLRLYFEKPNVNYNAGSLRYNVRTLNVDLPSFDEALDAMDGFSRRNNSPVDLFAEYRNAHIAEIRGEIAKLEGFFFDRKEIFKQRSNSDNYVGVNAMRDLLYGPEGEFGRFFVAIVNKDESFLAENKNAFMKKYLENGTSTVSNVDRQAIDDLIDVLNERIERDVNSRSIIGSRLRNIKDKATEAAYNICRWYELMDLSSADRLRSGDSGRDYEATKKSLLEKLGAIRDHDAASETDNGKRVGMLVLSYTADELTKKLTGEWLMGSEKYMFADFLLTDNVLLDNNFKPDISTTFCPMKDFNIFSRILRHIETEKPSLFERIEEIYGRDRENNNYNSAKLIVKYAEEYLQEEIALPDEFEEYEKQAALQAKSRFDEFKGTYAYDSNNGRVFSNDSFCSRLLDIAGHVYKKCCEDKNFGFFQSFVTQAVEQVRISAADYQDVLSRELESIVKARPERLTGGEKYIELIKQQIELQNFIVAEDWMGRLTRKDFDLNLERPEAIMFLESYCKRMDMLSSGIGDVNRSLNDQLGPIIISNTDAAEKGKRILENWPIPEEGSSPEKISQLLELLGWNDITAERVEVGGMDNAEVYKVTRTTRLLSSNLPAHPIAAFGSLIPVVGEENVEFENLFVVCLYGINAADSLISKLTRLNMLRGNKIVLADCVIGISERRELAQRLKQSSCRVEGTCLVIDRTLIRNVIMLYQESRVNSMLIATGMPFGYYQPYIPDSSNPMPPEMFIGRVDELKDIKDPKGINLIYGGRQMGKSALLKKAKLDIESNHKQIALLVDINTRNCPEAAIRVSDELIKNGLLSEDRRTDNWGELCNSIKDILSGSDIEYLLIMLDEAEKFITDCQHCGYTPLVELNSVHDSFKNRFKYVIAGVNNVMRFRNEVALGNNSVIAHIPSRTIFPFSEEESRELLITPLSYLGFSIPSMSVVTTILASVNYYPGLIQYYCKKLVETLRSPNYAGYNPQSVPPYVVSEDLLRTVLRDRNFTNEIRSKIEATLFLDQDEGCYYYQLALAMGLTCYLKGSSDRNWYTFAELKDTIRGYSFVNLMALSEDNLRGLVGELCDLFIFKNVGGDRFRFTNRAILDLLGTADDIVRKLEERGWVE